MSESTREERRKPEFIYPRMYIDLPNIGQADFTMSKDDSPVETRLGADVVIMYAYDMEDYFEIVSASELRKLNMNVEVMHCLAVNNLDNLNLEIRAHGDGPMKMLTAGGDFEATLLLLPYVWDSVASMVDGRVVAVIPARDLIFFTGGNDSEGLTEMRRQTSRALEQADKPLSRHFFVRVSNGWEPYKGHAD